MNFVLAFLKLNLLILMLPIFLIGVFIGFIKTSLIAGVEFFDSIFEELS